MSLVEIQPDDTLNRARNGDINAFQSLFAVFQPQLKSYLYRLVTDRDDAEDLAHDTFIRAFDKLGSFRGESSFKTWVFQVATHLAYDFLKSRKRWDVDAKSRAKGLCLSDADVYRAIEQASQASGEGAYEMTEHISHCFTCMSKTLKNGVCHQCSELNGWFNPRQNRQEALNRLDLVRGSTKYDRDALFALRTSLVKAIDPMRGRGAGLQDILMRCDRLAMGEVSSME